MAAKGNFEIDTKQGKREISKKIINLASRIASSDRPLRARSFDQRDLIGKTVGEYVTVGNPRPVFTSVESPNPAIFHVQLYDDGTFLLADSWGDMECKHTDFYFFDGKEVKYSNSLFG